MRTMLCRTRSVQLGIWIASLFALFVVFVEAASRECPAVGTTLSFSLTTTSKVTLVKSHGNPSLCNLVRDGGDNRTSSSLIPLARSYNGLKWEFSGGGYAASFRSRWECETDACSIDLPSGTYVLQSRSVRTPTRHEQIARFLESASFGATPSDLGNFSGSFSQWIKDQIQVAPTYHREYFRRHANPVWRFHKPEFAAALSPCSKLSTWRRDALTVKDRNKQLVVKKVDGDWWEVYVDGFLRTMSKSLEFVSGAFRFQDGESYKICSPLRSMRRGVYSVMVKAKNGRLVCRQVKTESLRITFPATFIPPGAVSGRIARLSNTDVWQKTSNFLPEYVKIPLIGKNRCSNVTQDYSGLGEPVFFQTYGGEWLIHDPRIVMMENSLDSPKGDGGYASWASNKTSACANVGRTVFNEETCVMANGDVCLPGSKTPEDMVSRGVLCGSHGEVANDPKLGDSWLDVSAIDNVRSRKSGLPTDTSGTRFGQQREYVWSQIVMTSKDQLRQRAAWALSQIFALPKSSVGSQARLTESFLSYYDIFVKHGLGNYRDVLRETTFHPLMGESLSFINSRSVASAFQKFGIKRYPDENFAREIMQLFTIGLVELNNDGTPRLTSQNKTIPTYDSQNIISFASAWTGFLRQPGRANYESVKGTVNRVDPMRLVASFRDRFPKSDLRGGFIGDQYPLCKDLPKQHYLNQGAKYRLLGFLPRPEYVTDHVRWRESTNAKRLVLAPGVSGLYEKLCAEGPSGGCKFPGVVVLDESLDCGLSEVEECGDIDIPRIVKVGKVFYEYISFPCVRNSFYQGIRVSSGRKTGVAVCADPSIPVASEACCEIGSATVATTSCRFAGERMTLATATRRCKSTGKEICDYTRFRFNETCPHLGSHWTNVPCKVQAKVNSNGEVAIVHSTETRVSPFLKDDTPSFFGVPWSAALYPKGKTCGDSDCSIAEDGSCLCDVEIFESGVFAAPPASKSKLLAMLKVAFPPSNLLGGSYTVSSVNGFKYYSKDGNCCDSATVFEVTDRYQRVLFLKNTQSFVSVSNTTFKFRNPPQFNSVDPQDYSVVQAIHETDALIDYLFFHRNTAPFVAYRLIQRFGISNPSPRYVSTVANAFRRGSITIGGNMFGSGRYGDLQATFAAIVLDRDLQNSAASADPFTGGLREPILKVIGFMRATEFQSTIPLVELDLMDSKIGQMAYEQPSVFSFFRPDYSPAGAASNLTLVAPEAEVMSSGKVIGFIEGLWGLVDNGLTACGNGFGYAGCKHDIAGQLNTGLDDSDLKTAIDQMSTLLTGGRLSVRKKGIILQTADTEIDSVEAAKTALKMIVTTPEFHSTNTDNELAKSRNEAGSRNVGKGKYRAVIHLALRGGCDSFNVLVPHPSCTKLHNEYTSVRGPIALPDANILEINATTSGQKCDSFGLHHELPFLKKMYDDGDLVFLANTGVLTEPVSKFDFKAKTATQLFAHNEMQAEIDRLDPLNSAVGTGTLGRMADILEQRGFRTGRTVVESSPLNLAGLSSAPDPIFTLDQDGVRLLNLTDLTSSGAREVVDYLNGRGLENQRSGTFGEVWSTVLDRSLNQTEKLYYLLQANTETVTEFGTEPLDKRLKLVSQLIQTRVERDIDRELFFVTYGSFDHHADVVEPLAEKLFSVNNAVEDLVSELKALGVWDDVVIIQTSDFARTLVPNSGGGSDHAWGGNYWMAGGKVNGNRIVGEYPSLSLESEVCVDNVRGRLLPTTPWDSPFQAIANWMGVRNSQSVELDRVLPNRRSFPKLLRGGDVFES